MANEVIKIALTGASGRMGHEIIDAALSDPLFKIVALYENANSKTIGEIIDGIEIKSMISDCIKEADVLIDFTTPLSTIKNIETCVKYKKPIVIGTTGMKEDFYLQAKALSEEIPILVSSNMSIGINVMNQIVKEATKYLSDYDIEIVEAHHNKKIDAPSGTALLLAEQILSVRGGSLKENIILNRFKENSARERGKIGISSIRAGNIVGDHDVYFAGNNELIKISHSAGSRKIFALGALRAAKFLVGQKKGFFSMKEVLGL